MGDRFVEGMYYNPRPSHKAYRAAAKSIREWGCEGVRAAARYVGEEAAHGMLAEHVQQNVSKEHPGVHLTGYESTEEIQEQIEQHRNRTIEETLSDDELKEVNEAKKTLRRFGLS